MKIYIAILHMQIGELVVIPFLSKKKAKKCKRSWVDYYKDNEYEIPKISILQRKVRR